MITDADASLDISFEPKGELASAVRRTVTALFSGLQLEPDLVSRMALAAHELVENATKFSPHESPRVRVIVDLDDETGRVSIRTYNRARPEDIELLQQTLRELLELPDAYQAYSRLMRKNARRIDGSGLGLARIRAEAEMDIDYDIVGDEVCIKARTGGAR